MIKIENVHTYGWEAAIRGMRNPLNSWEKSDSDFGNGTLLWLGENDYELMMKLVRAGTDHKKFMRMINVTMDITAPLYWWKEFDTYKVGTVRNSCSTMHTIMKKEFTIDDFSHDKLIGDGIEPLFDMIDALNKFREKYLDGNYKTWWWQIIQLLPSSYNQRATVQLNYETLRNIYHSRKNHKLDEWHNFCEECESLYVNELITEE